MHIDLFSRESRFQRRIQFPAGYNVDADPFRSDNFIDRHASKRFGSVQNKSVARIIFLDRPAVCGTHIADIFFVHHIERRTEFLREFRCVGSADLQMPRRIDF